MLVVVLQDYSESETKINKGATTIREGEQRTVRRGVKGV